MSRNRRGARLKADLESFATVVGSGFSRTELVSAARLGDVSVALFCDDS